VICIINYVVFINHLSNLLTVFLWRTCGNFRRKKQQKQLPLPHFWIFTSELTPMVNFLPDSIMTFSVVYNYYGIYNIQNHERVSVWHYWNSWII